MISMMVGDQCAYHRHAVSSGQVQQVPNPVGGVDHQGRAVITVTDEVRELDHLRRERIADGEVASGEELAEVQAAGVGHPSMLRAPPPEGHGQE